MKKYLAMLPRMLALVMALCIILSACGPAIKNEMEHTIPQLQQFIQEPEDSKEQLSNLSASVKKQYIPDKSTNNGTSALNSTTSGTCGVNITWTLDSQGTLTISGDAHMYDYSSESGVPWHSNRSSIKKVVIKGNVLDICEYAFYNCTNLDNISISNSVNEIGAYSFYGCINLSNITISTNATKISDYAFYGCTGLTSIVIPDNIYTIGKQAFCNCSSLTSVYIPERLNSIGSSAFYGCTALKAVHISNLTAWCRILHNGSSNPLSYAGNLYLNGELVTDLVIPNDVTNIPWGVFQGCTSLTSVTIPEGVTGIGKSAFARCTNLTRVSIPDSITYVDFGAFANCPNLQYNWYENANYLGNTRSPYLCLISCGDSSISSLVIHENTKVISANAFADFTNLTSITIPNGVKGIGYNAFKNCSSLTNIVIPDSVIHISAGAFEGCSALESISLLYQLDGSFYRQRRDQHWRFCV